MKICNKTIAVCLIFCMLLASLPNSAFALQQEYQGRIYQILRVHDEDGTRRSYIIPVPDEEIEFLQNMQRGGFQAFNAEPFPYTYTRIRYSGLSHEDSIVVMLLGDGFAGGAYGTWPNPEPGTVLWHFDNAMNAMLNTHPFGLFEDLFTVYVVHTPEFNPNTGLRGYLGTVRSDGGLAYNSRYLNEQRIHQLASSIVPSRYQAMLQILSNTSGGGEALRGEL